MKTFQLGFFQLLMMSASLAGCFDGEGTPGGNANWLRICESDSECNDELSCVCGVCTTPCVDSSECGEMGSDATCGAPSSLGAVCQTTRACVVSCETSDKCQEYLGEAYACVSNACVFDEDHVSDSHRGGTPSRCAGPARSAAVTWDEDTSLGSATNAFSRLEGTCGASFQWDAAPFDTRAVNPESGQDNVTVEVRLDHSSARLVEQETTYGEPGTCRTLEVEASFSLRTDDGVFDTMGRTVIALGVWGEVSGLAFTIPVDEHSGSLVVPLMPGESGSFLIASDGADETCSGTVTFTTQTTAEDGFGSRVSTGSGPLGSWSGPGN